MNDLVPQGDVWVSSIGIATDRWGTEMSEINLNAPATLRWISKEVPHERCFMSLKEAVRVAMKELRKGEFLSAQITTEGADFRGDEIVELYQTGGVAARGYARF